MQEISRIPDLVRIPVPVGEGRQKGRREKSNKDEFGEILEREKGEGEDTGQQWTDEGQEIEAEREPIPAAEKGPDRGLLIDERA
jgi:hypothetical protein